MFVTGQPKKDSNTLKEIFDSLHPRIFNFVLKHTADHEQALTLTTDLLKEIWNSNHEHKDAISLEHSAFLLAQKAILDHYRAKIVERKSYDFILNESRKIEPRPENHKQPDTLPQKQIPTSTP